MVALSEIQTDALIEILNISNGRAAAALSRMVKAPIRLSVPSLQLIPAGRAGRLLMGAISDGDQICGISQTFSGPFQTEAVLMFPKVRSLEIVGMWMDEPMPVEELAELEVETLAELGNVLLYAYFGSIAKLLNSSFKSNLPTVRFGTADEMLTGHAIPDAESILLTYVDFTIATQRIQGYIAFLMSRTSIDLLLECVEHFMDESTP